MTRAKEIDEDIVVFLKSAMIQEGSYEIVRGIPGIVGDMAKSSLTRREVRKEACEYGPDLAAWFIVNPNKHALEDWLNDLHANRVPVRDIDAIRRRVYDEMDSLVERISKQMNHSDGVHIFDDVIDFKVEYNGNRVKLTIIR